MEKAGQNKLVLWDGKYAGKNVYLTDTNIISRTKCDLPKTNKRFLRNIVSSTVSSNRKRVRSEPSRSPVSPRQQSRKAMKQSVESRRDHSHHHHHHHKGSRDERQKGEWET